MMATKEEGVKRGFTFIWKIENFAYCSQGYKEPVDSPVFTDTVDSSNWRLKLSLACRLCDFYVDCFLIREPGGNCLNSIEQNVELSYLARDGSVSNTRNRYGLSFMKGTLVMLHSMRMDEMFADKRTTILPENHLTVYFRMWKTKVPPSDGARTLARTRIGVECKLFTQIIKGFSDCAPTAMIFIPSASEGNPALGMKLHLAKDHCCDDNLQLEITSTENARRKFSTCGVSLLDVTGSKIGCGKSCFRFGSKGAEQIWKFPLILTRWDLLAKRNQYLPADVLTLQFEYASCMGILSSEIEKTEYEPVVKPIDSASYPGKMSIKTSNATTDLGNLYKNSVFCDVNLGTGTETFPAHKAILSARSPVFMAMFGSEMREKVNDRVDIPDIDDGTVHRLLLYIYTDSIEDLQWHTALQLYVAADKYAILSLRNKCSSFLKENLRPDGACEVLVLADTHHDEDLKTYVQNFMLRHDKDIFCSDVWKVFMKDNLQLASEVMFMDLQQRLENRY